MGPGFKKPSAKTLGLIREECGSRPLSPKEIQAALKVAAVKAQSMIPWSINAALGNNDLALMPLSPVDLKSGWQDHARSKTGIERLVPLWKETIAALRAVVAARRAPNDPAEYALPFVAKRAGSYEGNHRG